MEYLGILLWLDDGMERREPYRGITINPCEKEMEKATPPRNRENAGEKEIDCFWKRDGFIGV
ncbi:MAG: hypothetical protein GY940_16585 [bacterium]|nr:hypothetical protein [bacterium]